MDFIGTLRIYLSTYIVRKQFLQLRRGTKAGVLRAEVQSSPLRKAKRRA